MDSWLILAISAYLLLSINGAVDRAIVHQEKTKPIVISFWVSSFSVATAALVVIGWLPVPFAEHFKFQAVDAGLTALAILAGFLTQLGILNLYRALSRGEATRVLSVMGALMPIISFVAAYYFIEERLNDQKIAGFAVLIVATLVLTAKNKKSKIINNPLWIVFAGLASLTLGLQSILAKFVFDNYQHFISAYALTGLGAGIYALTITALSANVRAEINAIRGKKRGKKPAKVSNQLPWIMTNSVIGGLAIILLNLSVSLGSPTLVNALRGVQYAGVFLIAILLAQSHKKLLDEDLSRSAVIIKLMGIILVVAGITILAMA